MKKALLLAGMVLCSTMGFAAENKTEPLSDGKKRNEEAYERMLEQTGWKNAMTSQPQKASDDGSRNRQPEVSRPKNG